MSLPAAHAPHANVLDLLAVLQRQLAAKAAFSLLRLGDGEGRLLGFPEIVSKEELDFSLRIWFGRVDYAPAELADLSGQLRHATLQADVLGLPRAAQLEVPEWRAILVPLERFHLLANQPLLVDTAIHWCLQLGLFYRDLLDGLPFCGLVSCRDLAARLARTFHLGQVDQYLVPGEAKYPGPRGGEHYPARFLELRETLRVPFPGAVFLVGAGALGKIYCQWIKDRGGVALDIGSMCDAWAGVGRLRKSCHRLEIYDEIPPLTPQAAVRHHNAMIARDGLRLDPLAMG